MLLFINNILGEISEISVCMNISIHYGNLKKICMLHTVAK